MKVIELGSFFEMFGTIVFIVLLIAITLYLAYFFIEVVPEFRNDYKRFKDLFHQRLHVLDSRIRDLEDGVNIKKED